ncbi:SDR family NAD(P)-dependent oxidoreductase [uncultured Desulfosarcina sp.]|uniref:SDR family oxidoreductase n=1 Tax=uncultured Desulfosarcina sp. TaxID=218289 RepID=UPI0029C9502C|nr:SDR family NAD(P)-dependent oxidoreductase [uncultured Desulfosarcina sp.]
MAKTDKVLLLTGGSSGIGEATVIEAAKRGYKISFTYNTRENPAQKIIDHLRREYQTDAIATQCDVSSFHAASDVVVKTIDAFGTIDVLVNNAGTALDGVSWKMEEEKWDRVIDVNLKGVFNFVRHVSPIFKEKKAGKIVNVSSINGLRGKFGNSNYSAAKAGVIGYTKAIAKELGPYNINVNAIAPGTIKTVMISEAPDSQKIIDLALNEIVIKRIGEPNDVANVILFLASEEARHILGEVIRVDGGQYI